MPNSKQEVEMKNSIIERHAQTVLTAIVAGLIGWVGITVSAQERNVAVMSVQIDTLTKDMDELKVFARQPRFTKEDFGSLMQPYDQRISRNESAVLKREVWSESVEKRLNELERHQPKGE